MKLRHVISTFAVAGLLGLGVAGGFIASKEAVETKADDTVDLAVSIIVTNYDSLTMQWPQLGYWYTDLGDSKLLNSFTQDSTDSTLFTATLSGIPSGVYLSCYVTLWDNSSPWTQRAYYYGSNGAWFEISSVTESGTLVCSGEVAVTSSSSIGTFTYTAGGTYTITKYGVYDGVKDESSIGSDSVSSGSTYAIPSRINATGYHFSGWFTDEACTMAYAAQEITADRSIYAKYTTLVADSYIYYVTGAESATTNYIYSYDGDEQFGSWETMKIVDVDGVAEVHGVLSFNGTSQYIYKIPYSTVAEDTHVIISDGNGTQTANMTLSEGCAYTFKSGVDGTNANMASAIEFLLSAENVRNAVAADAENNILQYSVCGVSASDAATLYAAYSALNETAKSYVDSTSTYTYDGAYDGENVPAETGVSYADVMLQLYAIGVAGGTIAAAQTIVNNDTTAQSMVTVITLVSLGILATAGIFYSRKKHLAR